MMRDAGPARGRGPAPRVHRPDVGRGRRPVGFLPLFEGEPGRLRVEGVTHLGVVKHRNLENGVTPGLYLS